MLFIGAGASAAFGIPTMKKFVNNFEEYIDSAEEHLPKQVQLYKKIKEALTQQLERDVDLEDVFTVISTLSHVSSNQPIKDPYTLYLFGKYVDEVTKQLQKDIEPSLGLLLNFKQFVRKNCLIPEPTHAKISEVYKDLFNRLFLESDSFGSDDQVRDSFFASKRWVIFTTNYDTCLEYYFRKVAKLRLNTGFSSNDTTNQMIMNTKRFSNEDDTRLFKLHGSISWFIDDEKEVVEEQTIGTSLIGREHLGELMVYPIQQKELYLEPYVTMFKQLNNELAKKNIWIVIGYSFNDPIIHSIFTQNATPEKKIIFVHPQASKLVEKFRLFDGQFNLKITSIDKKFGESNYREVNCDILKVMVERLKYTSSETPLQRAPKRKVDF